MVEEGKGKNGRVNDSEPMDAPDRYDCRKWLYTAGWGQGKDAYKS
jgi:hypothetical protein